MPSALKLPPRQMTVGEFLDWNPGDGSGRRWQLRDGEPELMAPASDRHGSIQSELAHLLLTHLRAQGRDCRVVTNPGVIPHLRSDHNMLVPDLGVTCTPPTGDHALSSPVLLIEVLSPSNEAETRANLWAYATIMSVGEIVMVHTSRIAAEIWRRGADGGWPARAEMVAADGTLRLDSIGFATPLRDAYVTSGLV